MWDASSGKDLLVLKGPTGTLFDAAFSPDGHTLVTAAGNKTARLWSADSGDPVGALEGHAGYVRAVAFSPDGAVIATLEGIDGNRAQVRWWDARGTREIAVPCKSTFFCNSELSLLDRDAAIT